MKEEVKKYGITAKELAKRVGISRTTYYNHTNTRDLPFHILTRYGKAINVDFTIIFPEMPVYLPAIATVDDPGDTYGSAEGKRNEKDILLKTIDRLHKDNDRLQEENRALNNELKELREKLRSQ